MSDAERKKWDLKHAERGFSPSKPSALVTRCEKYLPRTRGKALDVAGGSGRHSFWLAGQGFEVTLADVSGVALKIATEEARRRAMSLATVCMDFENDAFPGGSWEVILCFHYLHRSLFGEFSKALTADGVLIFAQPTIRNLERHSRPSERFLLRENELRKLAEDNHLEILCYEEDWSAADRHEALLVARQAR